MGNTILKMQNITKVFPGVKALDNVNIEVAEGEIHALCGENGAGKSTLLKILTGSLLQDGGKYEFGYNVKTWTFKGKEVATDKAYTVLATYTTNMEKVTGKVAAAVFGGAGAYPVVKNGEAENTDVKIPGGDGVKARTIKAYKLA